MGDQPRHAVDPDAHSNLFKDASAATETADGTTKGSVVLAASNNRTALNKAATPAGVAAQLVSGASILKSNGASATTSGFQLANGTDIGTLYASAIANSPGSGSVVTNATLSKSDGTITLTLTKAAWTYCSYCGYCVYCGYCTYCTYCQTNCQCSDG